MRKKITDINVFRVSSSMSTRSKKSPTQSPLPGQDHVVLQHLEDIGAVSNYSLHWGNSQFCFGQLETISIFPYVFGYHELGKVIFSISSFFPSLQICPI